MRKRNRKKENLKKSNLGIMIGLLLCLAAAGAGVRYFTGARTAGETEEQAVPDGSGAGIQDIQAEPAGADSPIPEAPEKVEPDTAEPEEPEPEKTEEALLEEQITERMADMTTEEKVLQLFMVTPEALTGYESVTAAGERTREAILQYPVGGIIYFAGNLQEPEQVRTMLQNTRQYYEEAGYLSPFLGVDEEGGRVARISGRPAFGVEQVEDMRSIGDRRDAGEAAQVGRVIGSFLSELGFTLDFAPVADVLTEPENEVIGSRSFGTEPELVAELAMAVASGLEEAGVWAVLKHYPGHGATRGDTHDGYSYTDKTLEELTEAELVPFQRGIDEGIHFIMAAHISAPSVTGDEVPCTLSSRMITEILRTEMGYDGIVVTDAMNMDAVSRQYRSAEASVLALQAGVDLILMPADFQDACEGVLAALETGALTEERIDESVRRILRVKLRPLK